MTSFAVLIDTSQSTIPGCVEALQIDARHRLTGAVQPVCTPSAGNSLGVIGGTDAGGSSLAADDRLQLTATGIPQGTFGDFVLSESTRLGPCTSGCDFTQGVPCLSGSIARLGPALPSDFAGTQQRTLDLDAIPIAPGSVMAGSTWYFQAWYRDVNPTITSNFTAAIGVAFH